MADEKYRQQAREFVTKELTRLESEAREKGLSLAAAGRLVGIDEVTMWRWKNGATEPGIFRFATLAKAIEKYTPRKGKKA